PGHRLRAPRAPQPWVRDRRWSRGSGPATARELRPRLLPPGRAGGVAFLLLSRACSRGLAATRRERRSGGAVAVREPSMGSRWGSRARRAMVRLGRRPGARQDVNDDDGWLGRRARGALASLGRGLGDPPDRRAGAPLRGGAVLSARPRSRR